MGKKVTVKDLADLAGVSPGTVSRVLNQKGYLSPETCKKVHEAAAQLNFTPTVPQPSGEKVASQNIIGIAVPEIRHPYLSYIVSGIQQNLADQGFSVVFCSHLYQEDKLLKFAKNLVELGGKGLIMVAAGFSQLENLRQTSKKLKLLNINTGNQGEEFLKYADFINFADWQVTFDIVEHLINLGHKRIAYLGFNQDSLPTMERLRGFHDAMAKHNLPINSQYLVGSSTPFVSQGESGEETPVQNQLASKLLDLDPPPTAIVAINDYYALGVYAEVAKRNQIIGEDVSVVGYDDILLTTILSPPMSSVSCNVDMVSNLAATTMLSRIQDQTEKPFHNILVPGVFQKRESIAPPKM